jgi:hypothetical protein
MDCSLGNKGVEKEGERKKKMKKFDKMPMIYLLCQEPKVAMSGNKIALLTPKLFCNTSKC